MNNRYPQYTTDYISGVMSLRKPQTDSLKILEEIVTAVPLRKGMNLRAALGSVHAMYPTCVDFERTFMSLTFALATGVGKTRLMGAFIAYLYTQHGIRNFFVVAPNTTIYEKLKRDLCNPGWPKYIFNGLGCFSTPPQIVSDDDYKTKNMDLFESEIRVFVYNIDKFNKEGANARKENEILGDSFFNYLGGLPDLVLIMDESHHYRAERGAQALNDLKPVLGLELTATPMVGKGGKQTPFRNVVYEYRLAMAIADGYTRTPYAVTRSDIDSFNFGDEQLDRLMLADGIKCHELIKSELEAYAANNGLPVVKPFMLVVCKDTTHAKQVVDYIRSDTFRGGAYRNKTLIVHSKQTGKETEENMWALLSVESTENPIEIVIHVNMLKEGWDVNNLYTIVPLRTAASDILREQMVGRGLRLPYGKRTGVQNIDGVMLTAHNKFRQLLEEAKSGQSIFNAQNVIRAEELGQVQVTQTWQQYEFDPVRILKNAYEETGIQRTEKTDELILQAVGRVETGISRELQESAVRVIAPEQEQQIAQTVVESLSNDKGLGAAYRENAKPLSAWIVRKTRQTARIAERKYIPIPRTKVMDDGADVYAFVDFEPDMAEFTHVPIRDEILVQNLQDQSDVRHIKGDAIDFEAFHPKKALVEQLRAKAEIDYERCSDLLYKLVSAVCQHYSRQFGQKGMKNIVMVNKREIAEKLYKQMLQHFYLQNELLQEEVVSVSQTNQKQSYKHSREAELFDVVKENITSVLFTGIKKGVFTAVKFDSQPELKLARILETDESVENWLRPAPTEFNITYNHGRRYEPDFVVETAETIYLVEVKGEDKLHDPDVMAKKERAVQYCEVVTRWGLANGYKEWRYLFIPATAIQMNSSFRQLASMYQTQLVF